MKKFYHLRPWRPLAVSAFAAQPVDNNGAQLTFSPGPRGCNHGDSCQIHTISVSGPQKIKSTLGATVTLTDPNNASVRITPKSGERHDGDECRSYSQSYIQSRCDSGGRMESEKLNAGGIQYVWDEADALKTRRTWSSSTHSSLEPQLLRRLRPYGGQRRAADLRSRSWRGAGCFPDNPLQ